MNAIRIGMSALVGPVYGFWPRTDSQTAPQAARTSTPRVTSTHGGLGTSLRRASQVASSSSAAACCGVNASPLPAAVSDVWFMVSSFQLLYAIKFSMPQSRLCFTGQSQGVRPRTL